MFRKESDFEAFERVMVEAHLRQPIRILSYCVLSNHWHFVAWPEEDGQLTDFFRRLAHIHAIRWRVSHRTVGYGHLVLSSLIVPRLPLRATMVHRSHSGSGGSGSTGSQG